MGTARCQVMGVVNVTPDSFSDGGMWFGTDAAIEHGQGLVEAGADMIDVGGESTRPGALRIDAAQEQDRIIGVIEGLTASGVPVSVDTMRPGVARQALTAGASMINDVSGGRADAGMFDVAAQSGVPIVLMHWRGHSARMQDLTAYDDVVADVLAEIGEQVSAAADAGVRDDRIIVDPGIGFSKTAEQNWTVLAHLDAFIDRGFPVLVGASRKRFLGELLGDDDELRPATQRDAASAALTTMAARHGAWGVRVHDVAASADAVRVVQRLGSEGK